MFLTMEAVTEWRNQNTLVGMIENTETMIIEGENGHPQLSKEGLNDNLLGFFHLLVRGMEEDDIHDYVRDIMNDAKSNEDKELIKQLILLCFNTRSCRGGKGEKQLFYHMLKYVYKYLPNLVLELLDLIPEHGYWKDLFLFLADTKDIEHRLLLTTRVYDLCAAQHKKDLTSDKPSLYAKFVPSENSSIDKKLKCVNEIATRVYGAVSDQKKRFRKDISALRKKLNITETYMCSKRFSEIDFSKVPSVCMKRNSLAFLNETKGGDTRHPDDEDRKKARSNLMECLVSKKINGKQVFPHELVNQVLDKRLSSAQQMIINAQWEKIREDIVKQVNERMGDSAIDLTKCVCMCDVSGSMSGTPMDVSIALGVLCSEITHSTFRDAILTFSYRPQWHKLDPDATFVDKVKSLKRAAWEMNTNFYAALNEIGKLVVLNRLKQEDIPTLLVISDMQFDVANSGDAWATAYDNIKKYFHRIGVELHGTPFTPPPIVFWNVSSLSVGFPCAADQKGVVLLSGYSPSLMKFVLSGDMMTEEEVVDEETGEVTKVTTTVTPAEMLKKILADKHLDDVRERLEQQQDKIHFDF